MTIQATPQETTIPWYQHGNLEFQMQFLRDGKPHMPGKGSPKDAPRPELYEELLRIITPFVENDVEDKMAVNIFDGVYHPRWPHDTWMTDIHVAEGSPVSLEALRWLLADAGRAAQLVYAIGYQITMIPLVDAARAGHGVEEVYLLEKRTIERY